MIIGIGCDIVNVERISSIYAKYGDRFLDRILSLKEKKIAYQRQTPDKKVFLMYLAKRYAAKEAYSKALGSGLGKNISFQDIMVANDEKGRPYFTKTTKFSNQGITHLSMSDDFPFVIAYVVIEKMDE